MRTIPGMLNPFVSFEKCLRMCSREFENALQNLKSMNMNIKNVSGTQLFRAFYFVTGFIVASVAAVTDVCGQSAASAKTAPRIVLVPPFENNSKVHQKIAYDVGPRTGSEGKRSFMIDRLTEAPRSMLENSLGNIGGITVVERKRVDSMLVETEFGAMSGLVDSDKAVKLGKLLGANLIVMGTIDDIREDTRDFKGYGVKTETKNVICTMRVRLIDIAVGVQVFTKEFKGTKTYTKSTYGGSDSNDRSFAAVEETLKQVSEDPEFKAALAGNKPGSPAKTDGMVEIEFAPKPDNCDIEIDGKYVGGSPLKRLLPIGKDVKVRITKEGHKDWEGVIVPEAGLKITRELGVIR